VKWSCASPIPASTGVTASITSVISQPRVKAAEQHNGGARDRVCKTMMQGFEQRHDAANSPQQTGAGQEAGPLTNDDAHNCGGQVEYGQANLLGGVRKRLAESKRAAMHRVAGVPTP